MLTHSFWRTRRLNAVQRRIPNTRYISRRLSLSHADYTSFPLINKLGHRDVITIHYLLFLLALQPIVNLYFAAL